MYSTSMCRPVQWRPVPTDRALNVVRRPTGHIHRPHSRSLRPPTCFRRSFRRSSVTSRPGSWPIALYRPCRLKHKGGGGERCAPPAFLSGSGTHPTPELPPTPLTHFFGDPTRPVLGVSQPHLASFANGAAGKRDAPRGHPARPQLLTLPNNTSEIIHPRSYRYRSCRLQPSCWCACSCDCSTAGLCTVLDARAALLQPSSTCVLSLVVSVRLQFSMDDVSICREPLRRATGDFCYVYPSCRMPLRSAGTP